MDNITELEFKTLKKRNSEIQDQRKLMYKTGQDWDAKIYIKEVLRSPEYTAVTVLFSDIEGRLHMLDYDKDFLLKHSDNLTFDGSSVRGFTNQSESDLRLNLNWAATYFLPSLYFGQGKAYIFAEVMEQNGTECYASDIRSLLAKYLEDLHKSGMIANVAAEIEGFLFRGQEAEKRYPENGFELVTEGGYFNTLPQDPLRNYIDTVARVQKSIGFINEKDHPEVAPSQFEINWSYTDALIAADQIQLYKMICRQVANHFGWTASFLPKPIVGINGSGMHINISLADANNKETERNLFFGGDSCNLSKLAESFINGILAHARDLCLVLNPSVNSYRRLDPHMEAPNHIKYSNTDRGSMIRIPIGDKRSSRIEVRTVAPDANPYLAIYCLLKAGLSCNKIPQHGLLPLNITHALSNFKESEFINKILGKTTADKYHKWKRAAADRCPRKLGKSIKPSEIMYHHEITNQMIWESF